MRILVPQDVHCEQVEEEAVLLNLASGTYFGLDPVGARLWSLLSELGSVPAVVAAACEEFDADAADIERDVAEFVSALEKRGLVVLDASPGP